MHFNVLNYLLILILVIKGLKNTNSFISSIHSGLLNEVSDFDDIVETYREEQNNNNQKIREHGPFRFDSASNIREEPVGKTEEKSYEKSSESLPHDSVFSSSSLSDCDNDKLCPKHDIKHRDSSETLRIYKLVPQKKEEEENALKKASLLPEQGEPKECETPKTVIIKENPLPNNLNIRDKVSNKEVIEKPELNNVEVIPDYVYDFDNAKGEDSCKECKDIKGLYPIPLLESIIINKLLENRDDTSKSYPLKYVVKNVLPNFKNVNELDNPDKARYLKNYLHRRKRQLEYLKKRSNKKHKKKKKKKPKRKKSVKRLRKLDMTEVSTTKTVITTKVK